MTFKHTATHDGATFTRTSAGRTYTHCIVRIHNIAECRAAAEKAGRVYWKTNVDYTTEAAAGKHPQVPTPVSGWHPSYAMHDPVKYAAHVAECEKVSAARITDAKAWLAKGEDGLAAEHVAHFDARMKTAHKASDGLHFYSGGDQWTGRPDLAEAALNAWGKRGVQAIAVPATYTETKPRAKK